MSAFVEIKRRVHYDYEVQVVDRVAHALLTAGRPTWPRVAEAMSEQTGTSYSTSVVVNLFGRRSNRRQRIDITQLDDLVDTLANRYGLRYQRADGSAGRPIDRAWFQASRLEPLTRDFPR